MVTCDREREGILWATFQHLYTDYYVYQYTAGISGDTHWGDGLSVARMEPLKRIWRFSRLAVQVMPSTFCGQLRLTSPALSRCRQPLECWRR